MANNSYRNFRDPIRSPYEFNILDPSTWRNGVFGAGAPSVGVADRDSDEAYISEVTRRRSMRGRGPRTYARADERIYEDVCDALMQSRDVDASEMVVSVREGIVELNGIACERVQKYIAEEIALDIAGVRDVRNLLQVTEHNRFGVPVAGWPI